MHGDIYRHLAQDHRRLERLLDLATADPARFDHAAFEEFRRGLLRHIAMEEKVLLLDARRRRGGEPLPVAEALKIDHAAIAALLVPTPDHALVEELRSILRAHNPLEEDPAGLYEECERLAGDDVGGLLAALMAVPDVPVAAHHDGPRALRKAGDALAMARASVERLAGRKRAKPTPGP